VPQPVAKGVPTGAGYAELSRRSEMAFPDIKYILIFVPNQTQRTQRMRTAGIFESGNSQAVRLPKEFHEWLKTFGPAQMAVSSLTIAELQYDVSKKFQDYSQKKGSNWSEEWDFRL
jgi:hypothetical protein